MKRSKLPSPRVAAGVVVWNALFVAVLALTTAVAGETYLRLSKPFMKSSRTLTFVPGIGLLHVPETEVRATNGLDFWAVSYQPVVKVGISGIDTPALLLYTGWHVDGHYA